MSSSISSTPSSTPGSAMPEQRSKAPVQGVPPDTRPPAQSEGAAPSGDSIFAGSPEELMVDALLATEGGAAGAGAVDESRADKKLGFVFWLCVGWIAMVILLAVFAGVLPLHSYRTNLVGPP